MKRKQAQLPSMPGTVVRLLQVFSNDDFGIPEVVETLKADTALSGKLLKAANSSVYGARREICDLQRAAALIGRKNVAVLALSFSLADRSFETSQQGRLFQRYWTQSIVSAVAASVLIERFDRRPADQGFLYGLMARVGRLSTLMSAVSDYEHCLETGSRHGLSIDSMMIATLGQTMESLTIDQLRVWQLPEDFINTIETVQQDSRVDRQSRTCGCQEGDSLSRLVRVAIAFGDFFVGENSGVALAAIHELLRDEELSQTSVQELVEEIRTSFKKYQQVFEIDDALVKNPNEIYQLAMEQLSEIALLSPERRREDASEVGWLRQRIDSLMTQLSQDALTNVHNRTYFEDVLRSLCPPEETFGVLFIDIDDFKQINDKLGHLAGDFVIREVAQQLKESTRESDIVARYGGDELVIICPLKPGDALEDIAARIQRDVHSRTYRFEEQRIELSVSVGGTVVPAYWGEVTPCDVIRCADEAMYASKRHGKNCVTVQRMDEITESPLTLNRVIAQPRFCIPEHSPN